MVLKVSSRFQGSVLIGNVAPAMFAGFVLVSFFFFKGCAQNFGQTRFICTSVPVDMDMCTSSMQSGGSPEDLKTTVLQLRETVLQQKETIMSLKETIRELTTKLGRCESQSFLEAMPGESKTSGGSNRKQTGSSKNTMGDLSRTPAAETLSQLGQTLQSLKTRLEALEVQLSSFCFSLKLVKGHCNHDSGLPSPCHLSVALMVQYLTCSGDKISTIKFEVLSPPLFCTLSVSMQTGHFSLTK